uniref:Genomic DNA, chromosome 5, P1 clone: MTH16 n=1 Tax=Arabidopsis thaliana TaxID=3702 RepID=Q9FXX2_ARATH|nr:unnamed protein product [Arabidopsis thaliana]
MLQVLLREPLNENVIPVAKEFERRLGVENRERRGQPDGKEDSGAEVDAEKDESPFEFRALEVALEAICSFLAARTTELEKSGYPALNELASKVAISARHSYISNCVSIFI